MSKPITAQDIANRAVSLAKQPEKTTTADWFTLARLVTRFADTLAYGPPMLISAVDVVIGMRVKVQPYVQVAVSRGCSTPVKLPVSISATIETVYDEQDGPEYVIVRFDPDLYGNRPWQSETAMHVVSRGELHADSCQCAPCCGFSRD